MNRGTGLAAGTILLAGALLRSGGAPAPQAPAEQPALRTSLYRPTTSSTGRHTGEGPWRASCDYWTPARPLVPSRQDDSASQAANIRQAGSARDSRSQVLSHSAADEDKTECEREGDPWGIPRANGSLQPDITAIIAAVPDPVHTHLALGFDRSIDALMQAAGDNNYTRSFYWLPWRSLNEGTQAPAAPTDAQMAEQREREQMPGLIILKALSSHKDANYPWPSYNKVIYLFLVGESPSAGMDSAQLRNAFRYEEELKRAQSSKAYAFRLSMRGKGDLALIGSPASGAAASLRQALEEARSAADLDVKSIHIAGTTSTQIASDLLNQPFPNSSLPISYLSFGEDAGFEEQETLRLLHCSGYQADRFAVLVEDGTVYGQSSGNAAAPGTLQAPAPRIAPLPCPVALKHVEDRTEEDARRNRVQQTLVVRFPREISLLRNAQVPGNASSSQSGSTPSPYLHLSLKDPAADDTIPHFSVDQTPLSQEAELMSIQQELLRYHAQFIAIYASNILDEIFLANFLHRSCPDARLLFLGGGDLLLERETENEPYIGSITMTPYNLVDLWRLPGRESSNPRAARAFADSLSESIYNAASYTFNERPDLANPTLAGYQSPVNVNGKPRSQASPPKDLHPSLWATVIGNDGYYPLGIVDHRASDNPLELPLFTAGAIDTRPPSERSLDTEDSDELQQLERSTPIYPALLWFVLSGLIGLYCLAHAVMMIIADYWSPFTRDLAINSNDQPRRRSIYINIGTSMLFCMAFILNYPLFRLEPSFQPDFASKLLALGSLAAAAIAVLCTVYRTWPNVWRMPERESPGGAWNGNHIMYIFFNAVAAGTLVAVPLLWAKICRADLIGAIHTRIGLFFSYRCLHPDSGVSPVIPVLLLLLSWYVWSICQAFRLRFSNMSRPRLPRSLSPTSAPPLFVSDDRLEACKGGRDSCLYDNISSLLITREILYRFMRNTTRLRKNAISFILAITYLSLFVIVIHYKHIESVDRLLVQPGTAPTPYEALIAGLFLPLVFIALAGWLRMILVWGSLSRALLEPLEQLPLRNAFTRLKGLGWMAMLRETGLHLRWRDMARTIESIRQLLNNEDLAAVLKQADPRLQATLDDVYFNLNRHLKEVYAVVGQRKATARQTPFQLPADCQNQQDSPTRRHRAGLELICAIEQDFARFLEALLEAALIPYWTTERGGFIEGASTDATPIHASRKPKADDQTHDPIELHAAASSGDPTYIRLGEELLALRYVSLIRAVLGNISYLMTFVSAVFVLTIVAWNSYPFQPRQWIDWSFTLLLVFLGIGFIWVFAQMHRNAILSRITDTTPNELGAAFYWRIVTFGAIPLLTWLAYQFPQLGGGIFRILQPGLSVLK